MTLLALIALILPGLAWWVWLGKRREDPLLPIAQILGVSLSAIILMAELGFLLDFPFTRATILALLSGFLLLILFGVIKRGIKRPKNYRPYHWIGLVLIGMATALRLYQASALLLPNWVDSQHHYLIIRVILEHGGIPETLSPYLSVPFHYHYGFHAVTALFIALSGLEISQAMLLLGQGINAAIGLSIYALGKSLWQDWRPAAAAALLVTFVTRMPAYYLSWGRSTLTTGLFLLPLAMAAALNLLRDPHQKSNRLLLSLLTAGLLLSHYFAAALLALFLVILAIIFLISHRRHLRMGLMPIGRVTAATLLGFLLAAPWVWRVVHLSPQSMNIRLALPESIQTALTLNGNGSWHYIWQLLGPLSNYWLLALAGISLIFALILRKFNAFGVWSLILSVMTLPFGFTVKPFRPDHFAIVLFLPISLWAGFLFWQLGKWLSSRLNRRWVSVLFLSLVVSGWVIWAFPRSKKIVNDVTVLVTPEDLAALDWVEENTPSEARFYINTAYWLGGIYRGVDGGGWLLPYTGRWALVPTVFYSLSANPERNQTLRSWGGQAAEITTCSESFWTIIDQANLGWLYIREGVGSLQREGLIGCPRIQEAYRNEAVTIYQIGPD